MENITFFKGQKTLFVTFLFSFFLVIFSTDSFGNTDPIADTMELSKGKDSDGDGVKDKDDIDDDNDGILDTVEGEQVDTDGDGIPNSLDIDSDNDGILDNIEAQTDTGYLAPSGIDVNGDGLDDIYACNDEGDDEDDDEGDGVCNYNSKESRYKGKDKVTLCHKEDKSPNNPRNGYHEITVAPSAVQAHLDHGDTLGPCPEIPDACGLDPVDTDGDGISDYLDIDSDNDGILDNVEAQTTSGYIPVCSNDSDGNGLDDHYEEYPGSGDGITPVDTDGDDHPDFRDIDSDDDGIPDNVEGQSTAGYVSPSGMDSDNDGLDNAYENNGITPQNTDGTDESDYRDLDTDNDLDPDNNEGNDFNFDGVPDQTFTGNDTDMDGLDDGYEGDNLNDGFDVNDEIDDPANDLPDEDGTEDVDYRDDTTDNGTDVICDVIDADRCTPDDNMGANFWWAKPNPNNGSKFFSSTADHNLTFTKKSNGEALITGTTKNGDCVVEIYVVLINKKNWTEWQNEGGEFKDEGCSEAHAEELDYYLIDNDRSYIVSNGSSCFGQGTFKVSHRPDPYDSNTPKYGVQVGPGGALHDSNVGAEGLSGWGWIGPEGNEHKWIMDFNFLIDCDDEVIDTDGDGVTDPDEDRDGTDPLDPCDFVLASQTVTPTSDWDALDCDGDGVTNDDELEDDTDPLDPCSYNPDSVTLDPSGDYLMEDCDGDGVTNGDELTDNTDPLDPCDFILASQTVDPSSDWDATDCDGDGVTNEDEVEDETDPLDPCSFDPESITVAQSEDFLAADCDGDGVNNGDENTDGTDPLDPCSYNPDSVTLDPSGDYLTEDCDGDGVTNGDELTDNTDPLDPCDFVLASQTVDPSSDWDATDCDGDGVTNEDEVEDETDPLDPCSYNPDSVTLDPSGDYLTEDCDGDGVTNGDEQTDNTDPLDPCDFVLASQTLDPSSDWDADDCDGDGVTNEDEVEDETDPLDPCSYNPDSVTLDPSGDYLTEDCDGDGVTNGDEQTDNTDPLDPCSYNPDSVTLDQSEDYLAVDCDGDGVTNGDELTDNTDPLDSCDFVLASQTLDPSSDWDAADCDDDGVTNSDEVDDQTDPLDPCSLVLASQTLTPSADWDLLDCDQDGNPNGGDPNPLVATAVDDEGETAAQTEVVINILANDDYLPNDDPNNLGTTSLTRIGGNATGTVSFNPDTGELSYIPDASESDSIITIIYQVCNTDPDPDVCASATVTITVGGNTIDAVDDDFSANPVDGVAGGVVADSNVLDNDTLNGLPVDPADVTLTSTPTGPLTVNADGTVSVAPNTAAGTYTIEYTICEVANPTNCDTGSVTVVVDPGANVIDAVDDDFSANPVDGTTGGLVADSNVLDNDTLNGLPVDPADVTLTSTPTGPLTINADGTVSVAADTAPGTYTIDYTICEVTNPTNCDTASVTVVVDAGPNIVVLKVDTFNDENNDGFAQVGETISYTFTVINTGTVPLGNITVTDPLVEVVGGPLTTLEPGQSDNTTFTATYTITQDDIDAGSFQNTATVTAFIPDNGPISTLSDDPDDTTDIDSDGDGNPDDPTVTIINGPPGIDAVDDNFSANPVNGSTGGVVANSNVLDNDTLNGMTVNPADVTITSTPTGPLTVNADGTVSVAADTAPGTYTIEYTICEVANPDNCDTATVTVVVAEGPNMIDAVDDDFTSNPVDGSTGGLVADSNVLDNDTLNGVLVDPADVTITSTPTGPLTVNTDGTVSVAADTAPGTYTIDYTICEVANPENCDTATVTVEVLPGANIIDAVDDDFRGVLVDGDAGGLVTDSNVLDNDTLNGQPVNPADVTITSTPTGPLTVNADGTVSVAAGTPAGTYTIEYTICEVADPTNCDTATVTILVSQVITEFKIEVNQMVTPNNDGRNDFLFIRDVDFARNNTLRIYNRWGIAVFEGNNYNNQTNVFDGRSRGRSTLSTNDYLPAGVYFYIFEYDLDQERITDTGYLYISK
ncbi:gliding motility-associated C-terminal domain-containing protein [Muriicola soli]|uniref:DUF7507 domain-containing protein n=1 Tax=Muriicola soli TaxID=2507538 RepID=A0A411E7R4_9FLAO|nr:gliding motility-associated C-terminal domain-containing protein [Muriicola soli]QBA63563.1 hypothetical protein EQY75_02765 [Muriicola soli]